MRTIQELTKLYQSLYHLPDDGIVPLVCAVIIANRLPGDPVWLMIVGPSSGGKSEIINTTLGVQYQNKPFVHQISTITANAFLSGAGGAGKETSVLKKIGMSGVIAMKDFTSILSLGIETQTAVMGQLREIYDGHLVKETGTGKKLEWGPNGKLNLIAGTTEAIYSVEEKFSALGPRWVNYILKDQDPRETTRIALKNENRIKEIRATTKEAFSEFIEWHLNNLPSEEIVLPEDISENLVDICSFVSTARSPVSRNYRGEMTLSISAEMPMRMTKECSSIAKAFYFMSGMKMEPELAKTVYKVALDCIPKQRMIALEALTRWRSITTAGLAAEINYPTATVRSWLEDLNVRGICRRTKGSSSVTPASFGEKTGSRGDHWELNSYARQIMEKFRGITMVNGVLDTDEDEDGEEVSLSWMAEQSGSFDPHADTDLADKMKQTKIQTDDLFESI